MVIYIQVTLKKLQNRSGFMPQYDYNSFLILLMIYYEKVRADIIAKYQPWKQIKPETIKLSRMTGITNVTLKAEVQGDSHAIIYRRFGESKQNFLLSRSQETYVYAQLSKRGNGPKIYYYDQKFRLQEFIDSDLLLTKNMLVSRYLEQVAYTLSDFHSSNPKSPKISKENLFRKSFLNDRQRVLKICRSKLEQDIFDQQEQKIIQQLKTWVTDSELDFLQKLINRYEKEWPLVFSHNDLVANNILIRKDNNQIVFIDYEYATYNFPFYDIANYFEQSLIDYKVKEAPFFKINQPNPENEQLKLKFIDAYIVAKDYSLKEFHQNFDKVRKQQKYTEQRQKLYKQIKIGRLLCSFVWGWWSIMVSKNPTINFDYVKFAEWRYQNYLAEKKELNF